MATTTNSTPGRKTITLPKTAQNIRAAIKAGEGASAARPNREVQRAAKASERVWVQTMLTAAGFHRDALSIELSVGLAVFVQKADAEKVTLEAKKALNGVYSAAGYACSKPTEADYKTVNRRINVTADLFVKLGARAELLALMGEGSTAEEGLTKLQQLVKSLKVDSINDVLAYCGKPVKTPRPRNTGSTGQGEGAGTGQSEAGRQLGAMADAATAQRQADMAAGNRRASDRLPPARIITAEHIRIAIPMEATYDEVIEAANKMIEFAKLNLPHGVTATA